MYQIGIQRLLNFILAKGLLLVMRSSTALLQFPAQIRKAIPPGADNRKKLSQ